MSFCQPTPQNEIASSYLHDLARLQKNQPAGDIIAGLFHSLKATIHNSAVVGTNEVAAVLGFRERLVGWEVPSAVKYLGNTPLEYRGGALSVGGRAINDCRLRCASLFRIQVKSPHVSDESWVYTL